MGSNIQTIAVEGSSTRTSELFESIRMDILEGKLFPGQKLGIEALRDRYGAGASPVREALNRLSSIGLVDQSDQRGFWVSPITLEGMRELAKTRCWISEIAIRESILHGDSAWEEAMVIAYHRLSRRPAVPVGEIPDRKSELLHRQFHSAVIAACTSPWLRDIHERLFDHAARLLFFARLTKSVARHTHDEHRAIMEAMIDRDVQKATELTNDHIMFTSRLAESVAVELLKSGTHISSTE